MRILRLLLVLPLLLPVLLSCNKELNVNAEWKDITVVYGLLDQHFDTSFIKITKAFLGPGNALDFARIPDSSNYPDKLEVRLDEYEGTKLIRSFPCDTITIHTKKPADSNAVPPTVFYFPDQLLYYAKAQLNENHTYKVFIRNRQTGKEVTSQTALVSYFIISRPQVAASFPAGQPFEVKWDPAQNGKRYQLVIRFVYHEAKKTDPGNIVTKYADWLVFNNIQATDGQTLPFDLYFSSDGFYANLGYKILPDPTVTRSASRALFIFTVAGADLTTYMEVTEPSLSLVQERPAYTNITNGIGVFSSRYVNSTDSLAISAITQAELKVNEHTRDLGF